MDFPKEITVRMPLGDIADPIERKIIIRGGITTFVGPNGSGKTQLLRAVKPAIDTLMPQKKTRYMSAGRLAPMENYRSDYDGHRGNRIRYDAADLGDKSILPVRHKIETILGDFASLSERLDIQIKVQERLRKLFKRDLRIDWQRGNLRVFFTRNDVTSTEYSSAREASGLLHLVAILAALYDDEVGCVLVDEPEVSLHPQLQSFIYQEMSKAAGNPDTEGKKLIFLATHSTEFVSPQSVDDLATIIFCVDLYKDPVQIDPENSEFQNRKIRSFLSQMGRDHKAALFCKRPLLVEGPSDQIMCSGLNVKLALNMEATGSQLLPVVGKGQMPTVIKLMRLLGKEPVVLADADALADGLDLINLFTKLNEATGAATKMGHKDAQRFARNIYSDFAQLVEGHWDDLSDVSTKHPYWTNRLTDDESLSKKRAAFSTLLNLESETIQRLNNSAKWEQTKDRLDSLLNLLSQVGCFILTKGTIENYYLHSNCLNTEEKPNASAHEVAHFFDQDNSKIRSNYADIIVALEYAAQAQEINEGTALRDLVLAAVTPALANLSEETTTHELNIKAKSILGNKTDLFELELEKGSGLELIVKLSSSILDVSGFPLRIPASANIITCVNNQMNIQ